MKRKTLVSFWSFLLILGVVGGAYAISDYLTQFNTTYSTTSTVLNTCVLCHIPPGQSVRNRNAFAIDFSNNGYDFAAIESLDSDKDGYTNITEINARTFPGDGTSHPAATTDTTAPTVTGFVMPATATSLTVSVTTFTATDSVGVTGYMLTETATAPTASATGWGATAPTSYTFSSAGTKTLYAWAKDAAGNVSTSLSDTVAITLPDTTAPTVTGFSLPATATSLTVSVTTFTATDSVGVTGYMLTETATAPAASATGWGATAPTSYTFSSAGTKTLYPWAKDAAGNVSTSLSATVAITLPDTTAPTVTGFVIPATATSLTVSVTTFTATDSVGVTGYMLTETATAPTASATGWSATAPTSYAFGTAGSKTLYAWAKDAAGNVSTSMSAIVAITIADSTAPVVGAFVIPATATSLTVSVTTLTATDDTGVTGYMLTETATAPTASATGWSATAPTSYTFSSAGTKTLYAWAKDAAGNVSTSLGATVVITLPDTTPPTVTGFAIPATATSLTVSVTTLTATDDTGVTGYMLTETAAVPAATATGWSATAPANYTFASAGTKTLYAWAKDAAGNVSTSLSATVIITLADATAPVVTNFAIPSAAASLTVSVTAFTATDNVGVTGLKLTETSTAPTASATGWSATAPTSYTFSSAGTKTLYAWAKDAAGNVSTSMSAIVVITLTGTTPPDDKHPGDGEKDVDTDTDLEIDGHFPNPSGHDHKSTDWEVSEDRDFHDGKTVFRSIDDPKNKTIIRIPNGILQSNTTYYWRAKTTDTAGQTSSPSAPASFTTQSVTMDATGVVPDNMTVKHGSNQLMSLNGLKPADMAAIGNVSDKLMNDYPTVNAGAAADTTKASMMIAKANGGTGNDIIGVVTPAGTRIAGLTTVTTSDPGFNNVAPPSNMSFPYGAAVIRITDVTPGQPVGMIIYTPRDLPNNAVWYKYNPAKGWLKVDSTGTYDSNGILLTTDTRFNVTQGKGVLTITDDDPITDYSTEVINGKAVIVDPGAVAVPAVSVADAGGGGGGSGCFIATAAFGSYFDPYVKVLRDFRDIFLMTNSTGRAFVDTYYRMSPPVAQVIARHESLKSAVRIGLMPAVGFSALSLRIGIMWTLMLAIAMLAATVLALRKVWRSVS